MCPTRQPERRSCGPTPGLPRVAGRPFKGLSQGAAQRGRILQAGPCWIVPRRADRLGRIPRHLARPSWPAEACEPCVYLRGAHRHQRADRLVPRGSRVDGQGCGPVHRVNGREPTSTDASRHWPPRHRRLGSQHGDGSRDRLVSSACLPGGGVRPRAAQRPDGPAGARSTQASSLQPSGSLGVSLEAGSASVSRGTPSALDQGAARVEQRSGARRARCVWRQRGRPGTRVRGTGRVGRCGLRERRADPAACTDRN
jgi:hypothetical protein